MMKNILKHITIVALIIFGGCSDDYLDRTPLDQFTTDVFFQTDEHALQAVNAAYDPFQFWEYYSNRFQYLGNIASDDAVKGGFGASDQAQFDLINSFSIFPDNVAFKNRWQAIYVGVFRANIVLDNVPDIDMDATLKARIIAEAKFLRALNYFNLVVAFGGVPLIDRQLGIDEQNVPRSTTAETWAFIEKDLTEAAADLPVSYGAADVGRATRGAANGLLGKALVYQEKWAGAETALKKLTTGADAVYDLVPDYRSLFDGTNENSVESVFEIQFASGVSVLPWATPADGNGSALNTTSGPQGAGYDGWGFNVPTQDLIDAYETTALGGEDPRLSATVFRDGDVVNGIPYEAQSETGYRCKKYVIGDGINGSSVIDSPVNLHVLRYADILLLLAEALNEQGGKEAEAETYLNMVRDRAGLTLVAGNNQAALRSLILQERRIELAMEGERFFDLVRTGEAATVLAAVGFEAPKHNLMPIPQAEMDVNTALAGNQNPGYN
ncbi:RagB/SusD family nutrient uptake outer membrane protein [Reichenbachiella carrageenanivorans]|uniref:RagB/SusD family nutrient uptake outer membrane protein n=1 Tax=Reichenbachiella carrageenanivorans TaxID=2979869 RepID=A0ABY6D0X0_9BACT|nr:RagB/SusD family nutrient uptake outer membrane protein [Reichenbachiella carrageenanivorans]UXX79807.1 RagB/SusD family nutrient uptake outer membrane protein [Reichenbachiella carrageenanivorans]